jgi:hypothetical protein
VNKTKKTLREQKFIESYIENGGNATRAYLAINPKCKETSARELGHRMLTKVDIQVRKILDQIGINDVYLVNKLKEGLESENLSIRVKYLDMILKLKEMYPADRNRVELTGKNGESIGRTIVFYEKVYEDCPLKSTGKCPIKEKVKLADAARSEKMINHPDAESKST